MKRSRIISIVILIIGIAAGYGIVTNQSYLRDQWQLYNYTPSEEVSNLGAAALLNGTGKRYYYLSEPQIEDKQTFAQHCPVEESTIVLGCYDGRVMYLLNVDDDRLRGVEEVTAAHETLHAVYSRLTDKERARIDTLVDAAYKKQNNARLTKVIDAYRVREPNDINNELHSILATEVRDIGSELEDYYAKYFTDRMRLVSMAETYQSVFTDLEDQVASYDEQLKNLRKSIESSQGILTNKQNAITSQRTKMDTLLRNNQISEYNSLVASYNASVVDYNNRVDDLERDIDKYNDLVIKRNEVATAQKNLVESINAGFSTIKQEP